MYYLKYVLEDGFFIRPSAHNKLFINFEHERCFTLSATFPFFFFFFFLKLNAFYINFIPMVEIVIFVVAGDVVITW